MTELHYHILLTLTCLAPVFIVCIFALYIRQYTLWEKCCRLETQLNIIDRDLQNLYDAFNKHYHVHGDTKVAPAYLKVIKNEKHEYK